MQNIKSRLIKALAIAVLVAPAFFGAAHAAPITYYLDGVTFSDGATASGSFVFGGSDFDVSTTAGTLSAFHFTTANAGKYTGGGAGPNNFILFDTSVQRYFNFSFANPLTDAGGTFALLTSNSYECLNCNPYRRVTAGSVTSVVADVPEPATVALFSLGLLGFVASRRKSAKSKNA